MKRLYFVLSIVALLFCPIWLSPVYSFAHRWCLRWVGSPAAADNASIFCALCVLFVLINVVSSGNRLYGHLNN